MGFILLSFSLLADPRLAVADMAPCAEAIPSTPAFATQALILPVISQWLSPTRAVQRLKQMWAARLEMFNHRSQRMTYYNIGFDQFRDAPARYRTIAKDANRFAKEILKSPYDITFHPEKDGDLKDLFFLGHDSVYFHMHSENLNAASWFFIIDPLRLAQGQMAFSDILVSNSVGHMDLDSARLAIRYTGRRALALRRKAEKEAMRYLEAIMDGYAAWAHGQEFHPDRADVLAEIIDARRRRTGLFATYSLDELSRAEAKRPHPRPAVSAIMFDAARKTHVLASAG